MIELRIQFLQKKLLVFSKLIKGKCILASIIQSKDRDTVVDNNDDCHENQVADKIDVEEVLASTIFREYEQQVLDSDHSKQHRHLVLNALILEANIRQAFKTNGQRPCEAHESCNLENLCTERLREAHLLVFELDSKSLDRLLQINFLFIVSESDTEWIDDHGQNVEVFHTKA